VWLLSPPAHPTPPIPKTQQQVGTLTPDVAAAVREMRRGRVEFKMDRTAIVHAPIGKASLIWVVGGGGWWWGLGRLVEVHCWPPFPLLSGIKKGTKPKPPASKTPLHQPVPPPPNQPPHPTPKTNQKQVSMTPAQLYQNTGALIAALMRAKPDIIKGGLPKYVAKVSVCSTMGAGVEVEGSSLLAAMDEAAAVMKAGG